MRNLPLSAISLSFLLMASACQEDTLAPECTTLATVRDLTGLDGCGWVLELENGERLEPYLPMIGFCGTPPLDSYTQAALNRSTVWYDANPQDGMNVRVAYEILSEQVSTCQVSHIVEITCLEVLTRPVIDEPSR